MKSSGEYYKNLRAKHGDDVPHHAESDPTAKEPVANVQQKDAFLGSDSSKSTHEATVNADALGITETQKDQLDAMLARIGIFNPETEKADNLQKLDGVGPVLEQHLHQVGIYKYDQVIKLTKEDYELLDEVIENFPILANRGDWNAQATELKNK